MKARASDYPFESFNARALSPRQVAVGFVPPESFRNLCKRRHTIIAGPRVSGKTTLLKMLQVSALRAWDHPDADELRRQIDFTGVFVPADRCWGEQLAAIGQSHLNAEQQRLLGVAAFTTQVLRALISAVIERRADDEGAVKAPKFRKLILQPQQELELVKKVAPLWLFDLEVPTLLSLKIALAQRLSEIHQIASQCEYLDAQRRNEKLVGERGLHLNFLSAVSLFLDIFESVTSLKDERWALLFDELELAPESIRATLTQALRSVDARLVFKLSIAPFSRELEENVRAATDKNDFDLVKLWYPSKEDGYPFSRSLMLQILQHRGILDASLEQVFGTTDYESVPGKKRSIKGSPKYHLTEAFRRLAARDRSFSEYLKERSINLSNVHLLSENERAAQIRKVSPLVIVREAYRGADDNSEASGEGQQRSRKAPHLYCGVPALLAVCEGNPRWLIGLTDALLDRRNKDDRVPKSHQNQEISSLQSRFCAFLRTIPCTGFDNNARTSSVLALIDSIGSSFTREIILKKFNPDPPGTFMVDSHATEEQVRTLEQAVYAGAIVFVPESDNEVAIGSLRGKRFRLAYLLAPKYKLPMVLLRPKSLSSLLSTRSETQGGLF